MWRRIPSLHGPSHRSFRPRPSAVRPSTCVTSGTEERSRASGRVQRKLDLIGIGRYNTNPAPIHNGRHRWSASVPAFRRHRRFLRSSNECRPPAQWQHGRASSTRTLQLDIGRFDMIRIQQAPSVINAPGPSARDWRRSAMRLGMTVTYRANSLLRRTNSLFGPRNSLFSSEPGIWLQAVDSSLDLCAARKLKPAKTGRNLTNSLSKSLFSGNSPRLVGMRSPQRISIEWTHTCRVGKGALFAPCPLGCGIGGHASLCPPYGAWISSECALAPFLAGLRSLLPRRRA
jgi:hypothetical protein